MLSTKDLFNSITKKKNINYFHQITQLLNIFYNFAKKEQQLKETNMKKGFRQFCFILPLLATMTVFFISCGSDDDEPNSGSSSNAKIIVKDEFVGVGQENELFCDYKTTNPNIAITWFDNETRCNAIPRTNGQFFWCPQRAGSHKVKAVITDLEKITTCETTIEVVNCDLGLGIIGDSKDKILRTIPSAQENNDEKGHYLIKATTDDLFCNQLYYLDYSNKVYKIELNDQISYDYHFYTTLRSNYIAIANSFIERFNYAKQKYGNPIAGVTSMPDNDDDKEQLGIKVYSGEISSTFKLNEKRNVILKSRYFSVIYNMAVCIYLEVSIPAVL